MAGLHPSPRLSLPRQWPHGARPSAAVVVSCQVGGPRGSAAFRSSCVFACQPCRSPSSCSSFFSTIQPSARQASQPSAPPAPPIPLPSNPPAPHPSPLSAPPTPPAARAPPPPRRRVSSRRIMTWIACSSLWRRGSEKGGVRQMRAHPQIQTPRQALYLALPHLQTTSCRLAPPHEPITGSCMSLLPVPADSAWETLSSEAKCMACPTRTWSFWMFSLRLECTACNASASDFSARRRSCEGKFVRVQFMGAKQRMHVEGSSRSSVSLPLGRSYARPP